MVAEEAPVKFRVNMFFFAEGSRAIIHRRLLLRCSGARDVSITELDLALTDCTLVRSMRIQISSV